MKKIFYLSLIFILSGLNNSFAQNCISAFTASVNASTKTVTFTNNSTAGNNFYYWNFGDGTSSTQAAPSKTYSTPGAFRVCLTMVKFDSSCTAVMCDTVFIPNLNTGCNANFTFIKDATNGKKFYFSSVLNDTNFKYIWTFGDNTGSDNRTPIKTYSQTGTYNVCLRVTKKDSTCTIQVCQSVTATTSNNTPCNANWSAVKNATNNLKYQFEAAMNDTAYKYKFTFGDGTQSDSRAPLKTYTSPGLKYVCLTVTKKDSTCTLTKCDSLLVSPPDTTCDASFNIATNATNPLKKVFTAFASPNSYNYYFWTFGDGTSAQGRIVEKTYTSGGLKNVCLTVRKIDSSCTKTNCVQINLPNTNCSSGYTIQKDPNNSKKVYFISNLNDTSFKYFWTYGDGTSGDGKNSFRTYANHGKYKVCLTVMKKDSSCTSTTCDSISVMPTTVNCNANFTFDKDQTNPLKVYFNASLQDTAFRYFWNFGNGTSSDSKNPIKTFSNAGWYKVCLTVSKKDSTCTQTKCDSILLGQNTPVNCNANFSFQKDAANPLKVYFNASLQDTSFRYYWNFGNGTASDSKNPIRTFTNAGWYKVCLTVSKKDSSCSLTKCDSILLGQNTPVNCNANFTFEKDQSNHLKVYFRATLQDTNFRYIWNFGNGTSSDSRNPIRTFTTNGWYKVCLTVKKKDSTCIATKCDSIYLAPGCSVNFSFNRNISNGNQFTFETANDTTSNYIWFFGDGSSSNVRLASHTYLFPGNYTVCLYKIKKDSSCATSTCKVVSAIDSSAQSCFARFEATRFDSLGINYGNFINLSIGSYTHIKWNFGSLGTGLGSPFVKAFPSSGIYPVCLSVYRIVNGDTVCSNTTCKNFNTAPTTSTCHASYSYSNLGQNTFSFTNLSTGTPLLYIWKINGTVVGTTQNLNYTFPSSGLYNVCLRVRKADSSCVDEICRPVLVNQYGTLSTCNANFSYQSNPSKPGMIEFTNNSSSYDYSIWDFGDGSSSPDANPNHVYTSNGTYTVCLNMMQTSDSCSAMKCKDIVVDKATGIRSEEMSFTQVYPNPFEGTIFADINSKINAEIELNIFDLSGRKLWSGKDFVHKGNNLLEINTNNIPEGICLLEIQSNNQRIVRKLIRK
jgi:PKD repeat protein